MAFHITEIDLDLAITVRYQDDPIIFFRFNIALNQQINGSGQDMASLMIRVISGKLGSARYADGHMFLTFTVFMFPGIMKYTKRTGSLQSSFLCRDR